MSHNISKIKLKKNFSFFSLNSPDFGRGHYNRINSLSKILRLKKSNFNHHSYKNTINEKNRFIKTISKEISSNKKIILDITNEKFLTSFLVRKLKKIIMSYKYKDIYIIDSPFKKNLTLLLNLNFLKCFIPFEIDKDLHKELIFLKKKAIGLNYFINPRLKIGKKRNKKKTITISFGASDLYCGTLYVLNLITKTKFNKNCEIKVILGNFFNLKYKRKINSICKKQKIKIFTFSKNFQKTLINSDILITNSGLTKYEGVINLNHTIIFSDNKKLEKIDKIFCQKTNQTHFSYKKNVNKDITIFNNIINNKLNVKFSKKMIKPNYKKINNFFI